MRQLLPLFGLISGLCWLPLACSAGDVSPSSPGAAGAPAGGGGSGNAGAAGASAGGSNLGGAGANSAGASNTGGAASAGTGGAAPNAGAPGAAGAAGSSQASCTPGTGTMPVGNSSVLDKKTCLTWTKARTATPMTNKEAAKYCASLNQDGIDNWRVPHPEELVTWPDLATDGTAYITGPIYIPNAGTEMDGCTGNSHSCNIAKYNDSSVTCAWQGVGFAGWVECVSGTPAVGTTSAAYAAASCTPCNGELATFKEVDCSAYVN